MRSKDYTRFVVMGSMVTLCILVFLFATPTARAQNEPSDNPSESNFKIVYCDGPELPPKVLEATKAKLGGRAYIVCDANAAVKQVQHLINIMIALGILGAIIGFCYAGYLYITGVPGNISKAHEIFKKVVMGFIIMLVAWFIVYQVMIWLTGESGFMTLLGKKN